MFSLHVPYFILNFCINYYETINNFVFKITIRYMSPYTSSLCSVLHKYSPLHYFVQLILWISWILMWYFVFSVRILLVCYNFFLYNGMPWVILMMCSNLSVGLIQWVCLTPSHACVYYNLSILMYYIGLFYFHFFLLLSISFYRTAFGTSYWNAFLCIEGPI